MAWDKTPWFVGGGATHSPEVARLLAYASTGGAQGIVTPGDLKVVPLAVAGASVRVLVGACLILSNASGGAQQTYVGRNVSEDVKAISVTGSGSGRNDLVIAQIKDPFMAGEQWDDPADPTTGTYIFTEVVPNVSAAVIETNETATAYLKAQGISGIPLAAVVLPANTSTITAARIKDLRKLALPRESTYTAIMPANAVQDYDLTAGDWAVWPANGTWGAGQQSMDIPAWATTAFIEIQVNSFAHVAPAFIGYLRVLLNGNIAGPSVAVDLDLPTGAEHMSIAAWAEVDLRTFDLPGKRVPIALQGIREAGYTGTLRTRPTTQYTVRATFYERAV